MSARVAVRSYDDNRHLNSSVNKSTRNDARRPALSFTFRTMTSVETSGGVGVVTRVSRLTSWTVAYDKQTPATTNASVDAPQATAESSELHRR